METEDPDKRLRKYHAMSDLLLKRFFNASRILSREMGAVRYISGHVRKCTVCFACQSMLERLLVRDDVVLTGFKEEEKYKLGSAIDLERAISASKKPYAECTGQLDVHFI